jgi:LmbE family N-acetylglucosaminyl deacetylase
MSQKNIKSFIFISPHPDDAVWSCGGRMAKLIQDNKKVVAVTLFDGDSAIQSKDSWRTIARPGLRRLENQLALKILGAEHVSLKMTDAALRADKNGAPLYASPKALFERRHGEDEETIHTLAEALKCLVGVACEINAPLGFGGHIDHRLAHEAVHLLDHPAVRWYEDFPYHAEPIKDDLTPAWHPVDLTAWITAGLRYRSQVLSFFKDPGEFKRLLTDYAAQRGQESGLEYAERTFQ